VLLLRCRRPIDHTQRDDAIACLARIANNLVGATDESTDPIVC
jgi:hypothetical protein